MKPSEIRRILADCQIRLTKSLGQNFLHDTHQLDRIVEAAGLTAEDCVLEIGPGLGALTGRLVGKAAKVLAIEKDLRLHDWLKQHFSQAANLRLVHADALKYLRENPSDWSEWKCISNLPYSVASPLLVELAQATQAPKLIVATLQWEVVRRLLAQAGAPDYGLLTLLVQLRYQPLGFFKIPPACFFPAPAIDSACITLQRRPEPMLASKQRELFLKIARRSFSQRRKMMLKLLKADWSAGALEKAFMELGLAPQIRAESVTLEQFVKLTEKLESANTKP